MCCTTVAVCGEKDNKQRKDDCNGSFPFELLILSLTLNSDIVAFPPCERLAFQGIVSMPLSKRLLVHQLVNGINRALSPLKTNLLPVATSIVIDRVGSVPSRTLNFTWAVPLIGGMCVATTHSPQFSSLTLGSLWRWILCGSVVSISPNCAPLPCEKSSDVSATMCDVIFSENTIVDKKPIRSR